MNIRKRAVTAALIILASVAVAVPTAVAAGLVTVERIAGPSRMETACEAAQARFPEGRRADWVYLFNAHTMVDAIPGTALATEQPGPLLGVSTTDAPGCALQITRDLAARGGLKGVRVLGGENVVPDHIVAQFQQAVEQGKG